MGSLLGPDAVEALWCPFGEQAVRIPGVAEKFTSFFLPGMLQNKNSRGCLSFVMRVSPAGVRFFSLAMIWAGCSPVNGISSLSSLLDVMLTILDC